MHIIKPEWLSHHGERKDFEVYSCHVSPDGSRLVTAAGDGHVRIWSTDAIFNAGDPNYSKPKQLASMSHHSGTIHVVRFSPNGRFLASGADDKFICIYTLDPNPPPHTGTFGSNEQPPVENWRIFRRIVGHDNDIQDLAWAHDSSILVSVGLDSKVVIWSGHTFEKLKTLSNHQSHVKGVTFDPAGKYFATASDDRTIKVFRYTPPGPNATSHDQASNFVLEATITKPFEHSPLTTYFRRCSWSPDGNHIAAANAVNGPVSSVAIIDRGQWNSEINLIGHEGPVEVCAFSPRLFSSTAIDEANRDENGYSNQSLVSVIACAGQDKALSIWNTQHPRPLLITEEFTRKVISDLAWSPEGNQLFLTSLDGSIIALVFQEGDLGFVADAKENEKSLSRYGAGRRVGLIESTESYMLEEKSKAGEIKGVEGRMGELMGDKPINGIKTGGSTDIPIPTMILPSNDPDRPVNGNTNTQPVADSRPQPKELKAEKLKQRVTIDPNGRKRVQPIQISSFSGGQSSLPKPQILAASTVIAGSKVEGPNSILDLSKPWDGLPPGGLAALLLGDKRRVTDINGESSPQVERQIARVSQGGATPILTSSPNGAHLTQSQPGQIGPDITPDWIRPAVLNPSLSLSQVRLAVPKLRASFARRIDVNGNTVLKADGSAQEAVTNTSVATPSESVLEVKNPSGVSLTGRAADREPARITATRRGQSLWQDYLPRNVLLITGNHEYWAAACEDGSVCVWSPAGRRLLNPMLLESQPVILESRGWWLLCITAVGLCHVWNLHTLSSPHPPISVAPVLEIASQYLGQVPTSGPAITSARLNSQGHIILCMSNGDGYTYSPSMYTWLRLSEVWWAVGSQYWNSTDPSVGTLQSSTLKPLPVKKDGEVDPAEISSGIIPALERNTTNECLLKGRAYYLQRLVKQLLSREGYEGFESGVSVAHLENRIAAALELEARDEFRQYLTMYARRIGSELLRGKVEELLGSIMPIAETEETNGDDSNKVEIKRGWDTSGDRLCGWSRRELLIEVVGILGKHRELRRLTVPYARVLGQFDGEQADEDLEAMEL
ncbi:MAG: HIR complex subunit [Vezdaea aestivalis]|nr:MAG: HIR complex subunit [Vezdaea aestivalis]